MRPPPALQLTLNSDPADLPELREKVRRWITQNGWPDDDTADVVLAVDEALTNVIRHGYEGRTNERIDLTCEIIQDPRRGAVIQVMVRDYGKQVDPQCICGRDLDDVRPGGLGVHIIHSLMDAADYSRAPGGGMLLTMRKYRCPTPSPDDQGSQPA